jgi:hypothetical protein
MAALVEVALVAQAVAATLAAQQLLGKGIAVGLEKQAQTITEAEVAVQAPPVIMAQALSLVMAEAVQHRRFLGHP